MKRRMGIVGGLVGVACVTAIAAGEPRPPYFPALELGIPGVNTGELLLAELNCTACHEAPPPVLARLRPKPAPLLDRVSARLRPAFVRTWLRDPLTAKPGTTMPDLLHRLPATERPQAAEELIHFLWSLTPSRSVNPAPAGALQIQQGRVLYHQTGCVACHPPYEPAAAVFGYSGGGPTDPDGVRFVLDRLAQTSHPLPDLAAKYVPGALADFLRDPLQVRPGGRMPSLKLTEAEARAVAGYLQALDTAAPVGAEAVPEFAVDPQKARRGRDRFGELGCAACHPLGEHGAGILPGLKWNPLTALNPDANGGCLAEKPAPLAPRFLLNEVQRGALRNVLREAARLTQPQPAAGQVVHALAQFNCYACHARDGYGGPSPSRSDFFNALSEFDLGDEGRLPPHLGNVGHKLCPDWLGQVLTNASVVRPYMAVRMPQFGTANLRSLPALLVAADALPEAHRIAPAGDATAGAELVGLNGYSCITCHTFGPHPALGLSAMDMTQMAGRLNWDWFQRYLRDPATLRPGTRMPAFWPDDVASVTNILNGDTARQIAAIWSYLNLGAAAPPPPGLLENLEKAAATRPGDYD